MRFQSAEREPRTRGLRGRRGAALVIVLIFAVGALMLVSTMLALSGASAKVEGSRQRDTAVHFVARHGLASAITEINRKRSGLPKADGTAYGDPTGNGFGCILVDPWDGGAGYAVYTNEGANKRLLGRFKTKIDSSVTPKVLSVVAVDGAFPTDMTAAQALLDRGRLRFVAAEVQIVTGRLQFDRNAISIRGNAMAGGRDGIHGASNQVKIYGNNVPAVNISDATAHAAFSADIGGWGVFSGLDPLTNTIMDDSSSGAQQLIDRRKTLTNDEAGLLSQETLDKIAEGIDTRVASIMATGTEVTATTGTLTNGTYFINSNLDIPNSGTLKGSGTLVINKGMTITGTLDWTGEVIVANSDDAMVNVKGDLIVDGVLAVQGMGDATSMGVYIRSGGGVTVGTTANPGAFTLLGSANTQSPIHFDNGSKGAFVNGIMSIMGNDLSMRFDTGAKMDIQGSLAFVTPEDSSAGLDVEFRNGAHMTVNYSDAKFDGALTRLGQFYDPTQSILPVSVTTYVESAGRRTLLLTDHVNTTSGDHGAQ